MTWAHQGGIGRGKYYNLSADEVCTWPVAPLSEAKWLWRFSWYRNDRQQHFVSSGKRRYTNADIIIYYLPWEIYIVASSARNAIGSFWSMIQVQFFGNIKQEGVEYDEQGQVK